MPDLPDIALLEATERSWNEAIANNDIGAMGAFMHDDWIIFSGDGNMTSKAEFLQSVSSGQLKHTRMDFETLRVKIYGDTGLIVQQGTSAGLWDGQAFSNEEISSTTFIHEWGEWIAVQTMIAARE